MHASCRSGKVPKFDAKLGQYHAWTSKFMLTPGLLEYHQWLIKSPAVNPVLESGPATCHRRILRGSQSVFGATNSLRTRLFPFLFYTFREFFAFLWGIMTYTLPLLGKNRQLVTDELVEFEKEPVEVHRDFKRISDRFRGIYRIYLKWMTTKPEDVNM